jgi:protein SCO1/2
MRAHLWCWQRLNSSVIVLPLLMLTACHHEKVSAQGDIDVQGTMPPLAFHLTDVGTGKPVTAASFRGKVVMLYFGYTNCPNVCPMTLYDATKMFHALGPLARQVRFLFVTVDPRRDTPKLLEKYVALYDSPDIIGLRGTPAAISRAASRYHSSYSVHPSPDPAKYTVTHTAAVYVFGPDGKAQFINAGLSTKDPDLPGMTDDLRHLIERSRQHGIISWFSRL